MRFLKQYIIGWFLSLTAAVYGLAAMVSGRAFLPGLHGENHTLSGSGGLAMAWAYLSGGVFLFLRLVLEKRLTGKRRLVLLYIAENLLLIAFIASLVYVLIRVDTVS